MQECAQLWLKAEKAKSYYEGWPVGCWPQLQWWLDAASL